MQQVEEGVVVARRGGCYNVAGCSNGSESIVPGQQEGFEGRRDGWDVRSVQEGRWDICRRQSVICLRVLEEGEVLRRHVLNGAVAAIVWRQWRCLRLRR